MNRTLIRAFSFLAALLVCASASAQTSEIGFDQAAGWYDLGTEGTFLMTWASDGGVMAYRFGDAPHASRMSRGNDGRLVWSFDQSQPSRVVRFVERDGSVLVRWTIGGATWNEAPRVKGPYGVSERAFRNGAITLSGTLFLPPGEGPHPAAAIIHGSGVSTRDNFWYVTLVDRLARNGIAVLLPDKRGCGKSEGQWETASLHDHATDAAAAVDELRRVHAVDDDHVGIIGISQGGHVAPMVPRVSRDIDWVVNLSGGAVPLNEQLRLELANTLRQDGWPRFLIPLVRPIAVRVVRRRNPLWWEKNGSSDPIEYWRTLTMPALVVYGELDELDNVPVRRSAARLGSLRDTADVDIEVVVYPDTGHALYEPGTRRIREDFLAKLVAWIHAKSRG